MPTCKRCHKHRVERKGDTCWRCIYADIGRGVVTVRLKRKEA